MLIMIFKLATCIKIIILRSFSELCNINPVFVDFLRISIQVVSTFMKILKKFEARCGPVVGLDYAFVEC